VYGGVGMEPQTRALKHGVDIVVAHAGPPARSHGAAVMADFSKLEVHRPGTRRSHADMDLRPESAHLKHVAGRCGRHALFRDDLAGSRRTRASRP